MTCVRCGGLSHNVDCCNNPVTSFGLVAINLGADTGTGSGMGRLYSDGKMEKCSMCIRSIDKYIEIEKYSVYKSQAALRDNIQIVLVERKDTISYINLVQGIYTKQTLQVLIGKLTCRERYRIQFASFDTLWDDAGNCRKNKQFCKQVFVSLRFSGIIDSILDHTQCRYMEADWVIPKGRLKLHEGTIQCAIREFCEETGYSEKDLKIIDSTPRKEEFIGTDGKLYRNIYYVATLDANSKIVIPFGYRKSQSKEVRNVGTFTLIDSMLLVRDSFKKRILLDVADCAIC